MKSKNQFVLRDDNHIMTPEFRVSFPCVFKADKNGKFGLVMIFPKKTTDMSVLKAQIDTFISNKWGNDIPRGLMTPILDGDNSTREECEGCFYINGKSGIYRPGLVGANKADILDPEEFYPGCWARAVINIFDWKFPEKKRLGVAVGVRSLQKLRDDEPFVGRVHAADDFEPVDDVAEDF